jgi:phosphomannomutase
MDGEDALGLRSKRVVVADLDGTLAESKLPIDAEMKEILLRLLQQKKMAVIGGGMYSLFQKQLAIPLGNNPALSNLYLFPTNATAMYSYNGTGWDTIYAENLRDVERNRICSAFSMALDDVGFVRPENVYGAQVEDRGSQVTFSALGQEAPIEAKKSWDPDMVKRKAIKARLDRYLNNEFNVVLGGMTSIDVMRKGIDKAYGIKKITEKLSCRTSDMFFLGDKLEEGGNDYPVKVTGVMCIKVGSVEDTKRILRSCLL